jgi:hypothetical protein
MSNYAVLSGNTVSNIIVADDKETAETATNATCIEYTSENPAAIGWTYDETTGKFIDPEQAE